MSTEPWTVGRLLVWTTEYLKGHGSESPRLDAEVLLAEALGRRRIELYTTFDEVPADESRTAFRELVRRRAEGMPVAYLVGRREFYSLSFRVTPDVLIPRPETELLVVTALDLAKGEGGGDKTRKKVPEAEGLGTSVPSETADSQVSPRPRGEGLGVRAENSGQWSVVSGQNKTASKDSLVSNPQSPISNPSIADVGTGSGIIAVCLAKHLSGCRVTAIDISPAALAVARENAQHHGVADRIEFIESDLFAAVSPDWRFDFIVSNPPYVMASELDKLAIDVRKFEPRVALVSGPRGTEVIERLVAQAADRLLSGGRLLMEIGPAIHDATLAILESDVRFELGPTVKDLARLPRVVQARRRVQVD